IGSRFILSDRYVPFHELATVVTGVTGRRRPAQLPRLLGAAVSAATEFAARVTHRSPLLPSGQLHFMTSHHLPDATRAAIELGWTPTPLIDAVTTTLIAA